MDRKKSRLAAGALSKFNDYATAVDQVETIDPTGAIEEVTDHPEYQGQPLGGLIASDCKKQCRITEYGTKIVKFYASNGLAMTTIAERLGIDHHTFNRAIRRQPEVAAALAQGKANEEFELKDCLMGMARRGNVIAAIFLLKARHGWTDQPVYQETKPTNLQVIINAPMSTEEYKKMREANVTPLHLPPPKTEEEFMDTQGEEVSDD